MLKVKVTLDPMKVNTLKKAQLLAAKQTGEQLMHEIIMAEVVPFDEGTLQNVSSNVETDKLNSKGRVALTWNISYARRLYFHPEYNFSHTVNRSAKGEWCEDYISGGLKHRPNELFKKFYKRITGGLVK